MEKPMRQKVTLKSVEKVNLDEIQTLQMKYKLCYQKKKN